MKAYEFLWKSMVGLAISGLSGAAQAQYIVHTVGGPGKPLATVACMSNNGWVAGTFTPSGGTVGHVGIYNYATGAFQELGAFPAGCTWMWVDGVNNSGQVIAQPGDGPLEYYGYLYSPGDSPVALGALPGATGQAFPHGINDSGVIVGSSNNQAFIYQNGVMAALAPSGSFADCINDEGVICGATSDGQEDFYATIFYSATNQVQVIPTVESSLWNISDFNAAVGNQAGGSGFTSLPVMVSGAAVTVLPNLPQGGTGTEEFAYATGIDDNNHVIGDCQLPGPSDTLAPILWEQGKAYNLNNFATLPYGDTISSTSQITPVGIILAAGTIDNGGYSYVLVPPITISAATSPAKAATLRGAGRYLPGQKVTFNEGPNTGYSFLNWTCNGTVVSSDHTWSTTAAASQSYIANFTAATLTFSNSSVTGGTSVTATINLGQVLSTTQSLTVTSQSPAVTLPSSPVTVPAGSFSVSFNVGTNTVAANTKAIITATGTLSKVAGTLTIDAP